MVDWVLISSTNLPVEDYAPAAVTIGDTVYFMALNQKIYKSGNPLNGQWQIANDSLHIRAFDPALFSDDDSKLYLYHGLSARMPIKGVELDRKTLQPVGEDIELLDTHREIYGWERTGDYNTDIAKRPWLEGPFVTKHKERYYLQYSVPGTQYKSYADGMYVSDHPLGPYVLAEHNPFSYKPSGYIAGAGHGSTFQDKYGNYWYAGTMCIAVKHRLERRIGIFPAFFDKDGCFYAYTGFGDYPHHVPQTKINNDKEYQPAYMLLSYKKPVEVSSALDGYEKGNVVDEDIRTCWSAASGEKGEWLTIDLKDKMNVHAVQVNLADIDTKILGRSDEVYAQYTVEYSLDKKRWKLLADKRENKDDLPHGYSELPSPVKARYIRITNHRTTDRKFTLSGLRVFGWGNGNKPEKVKTFSVQRNTSDGCVVSLSWDYNPHATGYNVRYGIAPDKLYLNYIVYDINDLNINSLNALKDYYFTIDAFNENGITTGGEPVRTDTNTNILNEKTAESVAFANSYAAESKAVPVNLRCNYLNNPLGVEKRPSLSWQIQASENNWLQSAYQILVSSSPERLTEQDADVWNSGIVTDGNSVSISYGGQELKSRQRYYWKVRVWDSENHPSPWSEPTFWETSMLSESDWSASWISYPDREGMADRKRIKWVWLPGQDPTDVPRKTVARFRKTVYLDELPLIAALQTVVRGNYELYVNGNFVDKKDKNWQTFERQDILEYLTPGENIIEVKLMAVRTASFHKETRKSLSGSYAAFAGLLAITDSKETKKYPTSDNGWMCKADGEKEWKQAVAVGELDDPGFGLDPGPLSHPASLLRKEFSLKKTVGSARLYVTALGSYRMYINGNKVGDNMFTPEFTNYNSRIIYQTYDVTNLLGKGQNVLGSLLGDGWYGSPLGWNGESDLFGSLPNMLLAELHVTYKDGSTEKILSGNSWKASYSPILKSEIYSGEYYDARLEQPGWNTTPFDDKQWEQVTAMGKDYSRLFPQVNNPVRIVRSVAPVEIRKISGNRWLIDMGQNLVGRVRLSVKGEPGTVVTMRFAEILASGDSIYTANLRNATAKDSYVVKGKGKEEYTPSFTFHGFRYIELSGYSGELSPDKIIAEIVSSVENPTGVIHTSSELVNKMYSLAIWGQLGNFISVPTDCPQRDERLGYTGDGQIFWRTGAYNFDVAAFTHKWMSDITDEQTTDGSFTNTAPAVPVSNRKNGSPGWEDAGVIVPWSSWIQYGDKSIIEENWPTMVRFMDYVERNSTGYKRPGGNLGDWLAMDLTTPNTIISNSLWAMMAKMMTQMAKATGREEEVRKYETLREHIAGAFQNEFIAPDGTIGSGSQTSYAISLYAGMVPDELKPKAMEKLIQAIKERDWHLSTGFLGTPYLLFALSENGRADVAYRLLLNETFPSWGYMVRQGATTWWEHWDSDKGDPTMNSFNHYAFGSVAEWFYRVMAGINADPNAPGFKKIVIQPTFDLQRQITQVKGKYDSVYGKVISEWSILPSGKLRLIVEIPANTTAVIRLPDNASFTEKLNEPDWIAQKDNPSVCEVGSGLHEFIITLNN
jgi:alpha-L-rhamnosidase